MPLPRNKITPFKEHGPDCQEWCCEGWTRTQQLENLEEPRHTNPIHPLFKADNWSIEGSSEIRYDALEQPLRLCTQLLTNRACLPLWHTILCCEIQQIEGKTVLNGKKTRTPAFELPKPKQKLTPLEFAATRRRLKWLAKHVYFVIARLDDHMDGATDHEPSFEDSNDGDVARGKCQIQISELLINDVIAAWEGRFDLVRRITVCFVLTRIIMHELGHAATMVCHLESRSHNFYWEGEKVAEEGF